MQIQLAGPGRRWLSLVLWAAAVIAEAGPALGQIPYSPPAPGSSSAQPADPSTDAAPAAMFPPFHDTRFWLSGQANFIFQTHPGFHALYSGIISLSPHYEKALSRVLTLYTGARVNDSTEVIVDIEEAGGTALSTGLGLAGNPDLDIVRNPLLSKAPYLARGMFHKVFALSDDKIENERTPLSLFNELPRRRLEVRFGKFSLPDFFDQNSVGSDTHFQFTNWSVDEQWRLGLCCRHPRLYRRSSRRLRRPQLGFPLR